jgi:predicted nucleic acid-binding protein
MLLDTAGLLCYFDVNDAHHTQAAALFQAASRLLTHSYVLAEFVPLSQVRGMNRAASLSFVANLIDNADVEVVWVREVHHRTALALLQARLDKSYSLCDAVSFLLMREHGILEALTTDHHFEQEGFRALLR